MVDSYKLKEWLSWPLLRAHMCTAAVAVGYHASWRGPREAFRFGGLPYGFAVTVALITVALPLALLQLAVGQLSQQDAVGVWRAVPFFRGVGYLRLLTSFVASVYSVIYLAMTITYFLYTISNSLPFWECIDLIYDQDDYENSVNASTCLKETFMGPVSDRPEYFLAVALIIVVLWIVFPFIFYNPVKLMKRIFYVLGPTVIVLSIVIVSCIGDIQKLGTLAMRSDWKSFLEPSIWHGALIQALISSQIASGYLISSGDTVYSSTNVQWTAIAFVGANLVSNWMGLIFWYAISSEDKDTTVFAVLIQGYQLGEESNTDLTWSLTIFLTLLLSGLITMLTLLYPIYDRFRRIGGVKWRLVSFTGSLSGAVVCLTVFWGRLPALGLLADYAVPLLVSLATVLEILAFVFIYGWKVLVEDVEFLTGCEMGKFWVLGWCSAPGILAPFTVWWMTSVFVQEESWLEAPWPALTIISTAAFSFLILLIFASISVAKQVQYDFFGKLKSSFKPSRHWGPRDPITHYYWLARRDEVERGNTVSSTRYQRRQLGQLSGRPSFLNLNLVSQDRNEDSSTAEKRRSNSDDKLYTILRKSNCKDHLVEGRQRAKSLDWTFSGVKEASVTVFKSVNNSSITLESMAPKGSIESEDKSIIKKY